MNSDIETANNTDDADSRIVYVRKVRVQDLPDEVRQKAGEQDTLYAVHSANGDRLALVKDREMAFILAREHDFAPVTVH